MRRAEITGAVAGNVATTTALGAATLGWFVARTITASVSGRRFYPRVHRIENDSEQTRIVLDCTSDSTEIGIHNLIFGRGG